MDINLRARRVVQEVVLVMKTDYPALFIVFVGAQRSVNLFLISSSDQDIQANKSSYFDEEIDRLHNAKRFILLSKPN